MGKANDERIKWLKGEIKALEDLISERNRDGLERAELKSDHSERVFEREKILNTEKRLKIYRRELRDRIRYKRGRGVSIQTLRVIF